MLKIYWDNAIKHSKMLHLFFVPDKNSVLRLDENKQYVDSMPKNKEIYEYSEDMSNDLKDALNQIDWFYLFEEKIELRGDYDSQTQIPYDINYKVERSLGNKYDLFFKRRLGCIVVPVEVTLSNLQITEFNPSVKMFSLEDDFPLYFPTAKILSIKQIPKENIGALSYDEALQDLSCSTIDYLYATSSSNLDMQI